MCLLLSIRPYSVQAESCLRTRMKEVVKREDSAKSSSLFVSFMLFLTFSLNVFPSRTSDSSFALDLPPHRFNRYQPGIHCHSRHTVGVGSLHTTQR